jgi:hypothetical protein
MESPTLGGNVAARCGDASGADTAWRITHATGVLIEVWIYAEM